MKARERAKQEHARVVAVRRAELDEAEAELARRQQEVFRCREKQADAHSKMAEKAREGVGASELLGHRTYLSDLRQLELELNAAVLQQKTVVTHCESELEHALEGLREASREFQVIDKHRQHWQEEQRRQLTRHEQKLNDELAALLHEKRAGD